jgi:transposase-like protein
VRPLVHYLPLELSGSRGDDGRARIVVSHTAIHRWVIRYVPEFEKRWNRFARPVNASWRVDETYINIRGSWSYLYRAVDKHGKTVDFLLRPDRGIAAAQAFFRKALSTNLPRWPRKITLDGHLQRHMALRLLRREDPRWRYVDVISSMNSRATESNSQEAPAACWGALTMYSRELIFSCELPCNAQRCAQSCRRRASMGLH